MDLQCYVLQRRQESLGLLDPDSSAFAVGRRYQNRAQVKVCEVERAQRSSINFINLIVILLLVISKYISSSTSTSTTRLVVLVVLTTTTSNVVVLVLVSSKTNSQDSSLE